MCNIIVSEEEITKFPAFFIYNAVFSESSGVVTVSKINEKLKKNNIDYGFDKIRKVFDSWTDNGILFDNGNDEYIINQPII